MKRTLLFVALMALPVLAFGQGGLDTSSTPATTPVESFAAVTVIIPSVIGIDIPSVATYDLGLKVAQTNTCLQDRFPLHHSCTGTFYFTYTSSTHTGFTGVDTANSEVGIFLYSTDAFAHTFSSRILTYTGPGGFYLVKGGAANNALGTGPGIGSGTTGAPFGPLTGTYQALTVTGMPNTFPWSRADQGLKLGIADTDVLTAGTFNGGEVYFQLSR